jgi:mannose-6-phosphate isomerase
MTAIFSGQSAYESQPTDASMNPLMKLQGQIQAYAWGGTEFLPQLLGHTATNQPQAEYWLGAHPSAPATVLDDAGAHPLDQFLRERHLSQLQFLLKILDVRDMLSIQVHPTQEQALAGYARENDQRIPLSDPRRNYKDTNAKPELMVALSEFWLLHGFRRESQIMVELARQPVLQPLMARLRDGGMAEAFAFALEADDPQVQSMQQNLAADLLATPEALDKTTIGYWLQRWLRSHPQTLNGLLTPYFLNLVQLQPGEAIYQPAGLLHAYLEGQNVELMANSDNVLRAGLTPKHIDGPELLRICDISPSRPAEYRIRPIYTRAGELRFVTPFTDFELSEISSDRSPSLTWRSASLEILFCHSGAAHLESPGGGLALKRGESCLVLPDTEIRLNFQSPGTRLYKARNGTP